MSPEQVPHGRTARRLEWQHLPPEVRTYVEGRLGSPVVQAESQGTGFTPGFASRVRGEGGERLFVKAASKKAQGPFAEAYAEEARKLATLPDGLPATRILWAHEDELWVVLGFEDVEGRRPARPWTGPELKACLTALEQVAAVEPPPGLAPVHVELPSLVTGWQSVWRTTPDLPHLSEAASLAAQLPSIPGGALVHCDARDDNFLLTPEGALLCDWNWPVTGPAWLDAVVLMASVHGDGGDAELALSTSSLTAGVPSEHIDCWLAAYAGFMLEAKDRPVPPTSPYLRVHQAWYADACWSWLSRRRGWAADLVTGP
ncbi:MAG TPA: phosphotransferase [Nocardioidaceae bacterium]|nr:phosphotransferase [Nocardioidaceae bacterium]